MKRRILLIDDDRDLVLLVSSLLEIWDYEVTVAFDGKQAMEKLQKKPDLILLDRGLPDIEGLEICRKIRSEERYNDVPIIILSGKDSIDDKIDGLYLGADDYIIKPFNSNELNARIKAFLRRKEFAEKALKDNKTIINELKNIIDNEKIVCSYQPIYSMETKEALALDVASLPPVNSYLSNPEKLIKASIEHGFYLDLEDMCWRKAAQRWQSIYPKKNLIVNCTPRYIEMKSINKRFIKEMNVSPEHIGVEINERIPISDLNVFIYNVNELKEAGFKVIMGRMETGSINLNDLSRVKPNFLTIDMALFRSIVSKVFKRKLISHVVNFCEQHKIKVIAKSVESSEELEYLQTLNIYCAQGNILRMPSFEVEDDILSKKLL